VLQVKAFGLRLSTLIAVGCIEIAGRYFLRRNKQIKILENKLYNSIMIIIKKYNFKNTNTYMSFF
jgi:hypothetical protein